MLQVVPASAGQPSAAVPPPAKSASQKGGGRSGKSAGINSTNATGAASSSAVIGGNWQALKQKLAASKPAVDCAQASALKAKQQRKQQAAPGKKPGSVGFGALQLLFLHCV